MGARMERVRQTKERDDVRQCPTDTGDSTRPDGRAFNLLAIHILTPGFTCLPHTTIKAIGKVIPLSTKDKSRHYSP